MVFWKVAPTTHGYGSEKMIPSEGCLSLLLMVGLPNKRCEDLLALLLLVSIIPSCDEWSWSRGRFKHRGWRLVNECMVHV